MKPKLLIVFSLYALCASAALARSHSVGTEYFVYHGPQKTWAFAKNATALTTFSIPVYITIADRPHDVIGLIDPHSQEVDITNPNDAAIRSAAAAARNHGADAVVLDLTPGSMGRFRISAVAVKWKQERL